VGGRSLASLPKFEAFQFDFLAPTEKLAEVSKTVVRDWQNQQNGAPSRTGREVLLGGDGKVVEPAVQWLLERRDNRPVTIKE
jgi:hypothetical protein